MLLQKQIPNIFSGSVAQSSILKNFSATCIREIVSYLPQKSLRIDIIFVTLAYKSEKLCQIVDCRGINWNSPSRFRIEADNAEKQTCFQY